MHPSTFIRFALGFLSALASAQAADVSLGVVYQDEETVFELSCTNSEKQAYWVAAADSSCDCLKARFTPAPVDPGKTVRLRFAYRSAATGRFSVRVQLHGPEPAPVYSVHTVTGFVAPRDWLVPGSDLPKDAVIVDTRPPGRFAQAHIPRSLNLPAFAIRSRADLRTHPLVLVDEGFAPGLLVEEAAGLRRAGFSRVVVLEGGLASWMRQGGAMEGSESAPPVVTRLSAPDYVRSRRGTEWRVVEIRGRAPGAAPLEEAAEIERPEDLANVLRALSEPVPGRQKPRILVIAPDDAAYARIDARFEAKDSSPVYYLTGGRPALDAYRREQAALVGQPHQLVQNRPNRGRPASTGGCGTCPKSGVR
jgi:rhodanese-related sulfurtransferase